MAFHALELSWKPETEGTFTLKAEHRAELAHKAHRLSSVDARLNAAASPAMYQEKHTQEEHPFTLCFCHGLSTDLWNCEIFLAPHR